MGGALTFNDNDDVQLKGATDGTLIGNTLDRLNADIVVSGNAYTGNNQLYTVAVTVNMTTSGTSNPLILLRNPSGSGKVVRISRITGGVTATNTSAELRLYHTPTVTGNGTAATTPSTNIGNGAAAAVLLVTTLPTVSSVGTLMMSLGIGQNSNSDTLVSGYDVYIQANNAVLLTGSPSSNNREAIFTCTWAEV